MSSPFSEDRSPTILPTGDTPASDDPQHATLVDDARPQVVHDPVADAADEDIAMPATPGAAAMPAGPVDSGPSSSPSSSSDAESSPGAHAPSANDSEWLTLQGRFVDDPAAAVREAGERVVREFEALRSRLEAGSTEDLRTAFQRYRSLHEALEREAAH